TTAGRARRSARTRATMKRVAIALLVSGCSFVFVQGPPANYQHMEDFHCTSSEVAPMLDVVFAGLHALDLSLVGSNQFRLDDSTKSAVIGIDLALIAVHVASAIYGFVKTSDCQEAMGQLS